MPIFKKKSLGQHFLLNPTTLQKILKLAHVGPKDSILEIGPGPGLMTRLLAKAAQRVVAVEKDNRLAPLLKQKLSKEKNVEIIEADILDLDLEKLLGGDARKWRVVANLPYNIATQSVFLLLKNSYLFQAFYLMVQKEVAERLVARPGTKDYGLLSIFTQLISKNRIVMTLPPGAFTPPPQVDSALVEFKIQETPLYEIHHLPTFERVVQAAFAQRRKMIRNSLKATLSEIGSKKMEEAFQTAGINPEARAETIQIEQFVKLANYLAH